MNPYLTKNAPDMLEKRRPEIVAGTRLDASLKFHPASDIERAGIAAHFKALGEEIPEGYVAGWASTSDIDHYAHKVMPGAFAEAIREKGLTGPRSIKLLIGHDWDKVAGLIKVLEYRGDRLWIEAQLNLAISYVRDAYEATKMIGGLNFSVGFFLQDYEFKEDDDDDFYLQINRGDLFEVSIVPFPGNDECEMTFVKARNDPPATIREFEKALVDKGLAGNRKHAQRLIQEIKSCSHLFLNAQADGQEPRPAEPEASGLTPEKITELSAAIEKMKQIVAG